jgi:hypothetical protein
MVDLSISVVDRFFHAMDKNDTCRALVSLDDGKLIWVRRKVLLLPICGLSAALMGNKKAPH